MDIKTAAGLKLARSINRQLSIKHTALNTKKVDDDMISLINDEKTKLSKFIADQKAKINAGKS